MGFRAASRAVAVPLALVGCGGWATAAGAAGLWANMVTALLAAGWIARLASKPSAPAPAILAAAWAAPATDEVRGLRALLDQSPAPLITLDEPGVARAVNRAARRLFATDDRLTAPPAELVEALRAGAGERRALRLGPSGGERTFVLAVADVSVADGPLRLAALVDVQAEIHQAEADALRQLLQVLSHEVMNSLTPVASLAETAADLLEAPSAIDVVAARDALRTIGRRAEGLGGFVEGYRSLARLPEPERRPVDLAAIVADAVRLVAARWSGAHPRRVELIRDGRAGSMPVLADSAQIEQALINVLSNAAESARARVWIGADRSDRGWRVSVRDDGPGVGGPDPERIFLPFVTTKPHGAGVGLALARQILRGHGGDVTLAPPRQGEGAEFQITL